MASNESAAKADRRYQQNGGRLYSEAVCAPKENYRFCLLPAKYGSVYKVVKHCVNVAK